MILLGCLLAFSIAVAPRLVLVLAWIFSDRWHVVWQGEWIWPLLGIIFLPFTTIMYMLAWVPTVGGGGIEGWDWMWILLGFVLALTLVVEELAQETVLLLLVLGQQCGHEPRGP